MENLLLTCSGISLAGLWMAGTGYRTARRARRRIQVSRCRQRTIHAAQRSAENALHTAVLDTSVPDSPGLRWRSLEVAEIIQESEDCKSFYLVDPHGQELPSFVPGQHLLVRPPMTSASAPTRCYSLSSAPNPHYWRITVKRQIPRERHKLHRLQAGLSCWMHSHLQTGDCLWVAGPSGTFGLPEDLAAPIACISAGVGITPMASMIRWSLEHRPGRPIALFFQARDQRHWPLGEPLHSWSREFPEFAATTCFSQEPQESIDHLRARLPGTFHRERLSAEAIVERIDVHRTHLFLCGPEAWMDALRWELEARGVEPHRIHWESFASAGSAREPQPSDSEGTQFDVCFQRSETRARWSSDDHSLWELAQENGVSIPSGCLSGVCGCCRVQVLQGRVTYDRPPTMEIPDGECLTCIGRPASDLILNV